MAESVGARVSDDQQEADVLSKVRSGHLHRNSPTSRARLIPPLVSLHQPSDMRAESHGSAANRLSHRASCLDSSEHQNYSHSHDRPNNRLNAAERDTFTPLYEPNTYAASKRRSVCDEHRNPSSNVKVFEYRRIGAIQTSFTLLYMFAAVLSVSMVNASVRCNLSSDCTGCHRSGLAARCSAGFCVVESQELRGSHWFVQSASCLQEHEGTSPSTFRPEGKPAQFVLDEKVETYLRLQKKHQELHGQKVAERRSYQLRSSVQWKFPPTSDSVAITVGLYIGASVFIVCLIVCFCRVCRTRKGEGHERKDVAKARRRAMTYRKQIETKSRKKPVVITEVELDPTSEKCQEILSEDFGQLPPILPKSLTKLEWSNVADDDMKSKRPQTLRKPLPPSIKIPGRFCDSAPPSPSDVMHFENSPTAAAMAGKQDGRSLDITVFTPRNALLHLYSSPGGKLTASPSKLTMSRQEAEQEKHPLRLMSFRCSMESNLEYDAEMDSNNAKEEAGVNAAEEICSPSRLQVLVLHERSDSIRTDTPSEASTLVKSNCSDSSEE